MTLGSFQSLLGLETKVVLLILTIGWHQPISLGNATVAGWAPLATQQGSWKGGCGVGSRELVGEGAA